MWYFLRMVTAGGNVGIFHSKTVKSWLEHGKSVNAAYWSLVGHSMPNERQREEIKLTGGVYNNHWFCDIMPICTSKQRY